MITLKIIIINIICELTVPVPCGWHQWYRKMSREVPWQRWCLHWCGSCRYTSPSLCRTGECSRTWLSGKSRRTLDRPGHKTDSTCIQITVFQTELRPMTHEPETGSTTGVIMSTPHSSMCIALSGNIFLPVTVASQTEHCVFFRAEITTNGLFWLADTFVNIWLFLFPVELYNWNRVTEQWHEKMNYK